MCAELVVSRTGCVPRGAKHFLSHFIVLDASSSRVPSEDSVLTCAGAAPLDHEVTHENVVDKHSCDMVSGERSQQLSTN